MDDYVCNAGEVVVPLPTSVQSLHNSNDHDASGTASRIHDRIGIHDTRYPISSSIANVVGKETSTKKRGNNSRKRKVENIFSNQEVTSSTFFSPSDFLDFVSKSTIMMLCVYIYIYILSTNNKRIFHLGHEIGTESAFFLK